MKSLSHILNYIKTTFLGIFVFGCVIGTIIFISIYGIAVIDVTNDTWLLNSSKTEQLWDLTQHYLGWIFYRNSQWHFPIGLVDGLYSEAISIAYTDSIPLFAVFFKLLSPILPQTFQYIGVFGLLCYALMGGFGALITRKFTDSIFVNGCSSFLFVMSPCLLKRMFYHTALSAHFLILAAFCLWLYRDTHFKNRRAYISFWCILNCAATLINPYMTPMVLGIMLCSILQEWISRKRFTFVIPSIIFPTISILFCGYIIGIFHGNVSASSESLEELSFNLNQFFNPTNYLLSIDNMVFNWEDINMSLFLSSLSSISPWQEEGYSYLGLGVIVLLIISTTVTLLRLIKRQIAIIDNKRNLISIIVSLGIGVFVFTFLALSPKATFGNSVLYHIEYPDFIFNMLSIFRSTGRFIWPVYYGLIAGILILSNSLFNAKKHILYILLIMVVSLQTLDLLPGLNYKHTAYTQDFSRDEVSNFYSKAWDELGKNSTEIVFYPSTYYLLYLNPEFSCRFEEYALEHDLSLNITYMSRNLSKTADQKTYAHFEERLDGKRFPNIIYVFGKTFQKPDPTLVNLNYYLIDGYVIGTELDLSHYQDVTTYKYNKNSEK